jgi:predicted acyltransferase
MIQTLVPQRLASIDILRAIIMVLMIFVNDLWSLTNIPLWLEHVGADVDGMGLADIVFPAFLFIVGMSLPFAINNRVKKGESKLQVTAHVIIRSLALIIMGLFLVNGEYLNEEASGIERLVWNTLCCLSFILMWNVYPCNINKWLAGSSKVLGIFVLITLALIYKGGDGTEIQRFSIHWWGILGLIGWAYLVCGLTYTFVGGNLLGLFLVWIAFHLLCVASHAGLVPTELSTIVSPLGEGAMPALTMGGVVLSSIYLYYRRSNNQQAMFISTVSMASLLLILGIYTRSFWGISKINATPAWILICSAITIFMFLFVYWIADVRQKSSWFNLINPAGTNTLLCYLIPYFAYAFVTYAGINFPDFMLTGIIGLFKSFSFALLVVMIAGLLGRIGVQLKL